MTKKFTKKIITLNVFVRYLYIFKLYSLTWMKRRTKTLSWKKIEAEMKTKNKSQQF